MLDDFSKIFESENSFDNLESLLSTGDESILETLIDDISNYDVYDFIATLHILPGDSLDYVLRAFANENRHLINYYDDKHFADVVLNDPLRRIYFTHRHGDQPPELVIKFNNVVIWVSAEIPICMDQVHVNNTLIDMISYWLAECKTIINKMQFAKESFCIKVQLNFGARSVKKIWH